MMRVEEQTRSDIEAIRWGLGIGSPECNIIKAERVYESFRPSAAIDQQMVARTYIGKLWKSSIGS